MVKPQLADEHLGEKKAETTSENKYNNLLFLLR